MYCPSGGIPRPKAKGGWDCFFTFGGLLCTWPVKLSYRNQSPNCIDIMSSRVLHLPSVCVCTVLSIYHHTSHYTPPLPVAVLWERIWTWNYRVSKTTVMWSATAVIKVVHHGWQLFYQNQKHQHYLMELQFMLNLFLSSCKSCAIVLCVSFWSSLLFMYKY